MTRKRRVFERKNTNRHRRHWKRGGGAPARARVVGGRRYRVLGKWAQFYDDLDAGRIPRTPPGAEVYEIEL